MMFILSEMPYYVCAIPSNGNTLDLLRIISDIFLQIQPETLGIF